MPRMKTHPAANIFPMLSSDGLKDLAVDIKTNGLLQPVTIDKDGRVLDGRNRLRACGLAKVEPRFTTWKGRGSAIDFVISLNMKRRHLDDSQRAMVAARARPLFEKEAKARMVEGGARSRRGRKGSANLRDPNKGKASAHAAKAANVSSRSVEHASRVIESGSKSLVRAVEEGEIAVSAAVEIAKLLTKEQGELVEKIREASTPSKKRKAINDAKGERRRQERRRAIDAAFSGDVGDAIHTLVCGDSMAWMRAAAARGELFDLVLTDPPYDRTKSRINYDDRSDIDTDFGEWDRLDVGWVDAAAPLVREGGSIAAFCPLEAIGAYEARFVGAGLTYRCAMVFHKVNPGTVNRPTFKSSCEAIAWATRGGGYHFTPFENAGTVEAHNFFEGPICSGGERLDHPTQKPEWLVRELLVRLSAPGARVLDPFMGVGTVPAVAVAYGRSPVGIELDETFHQASVYRLREVAAR